MANFSGKVAAVRHMLLRDYLQANAGPNRVVTRGKMEDFLDDKGIRWKRKLFTPIQVFWKRSLIYHWNMD